MRDFSGFQRFDVLASDVLPVVGEAAEQYADMRSRNGPLRVFDPDLPIAVVQQPLYKARDGSRLAFFDRVFGRLTVLAVRLRYRKRDDRRLVANRTRSAFE